MGDRDAHQPVKPTRRRALSWWQETVLLVTLAIVVSVLVKAFVVQMFYVPSASMRPQFVSNDRILVERVSYWNGDVKRGDVVVFRDPGEWLGVAPQPEGLQRALSSIGLYPAGGHLVKRVVGVGDDHIECCDARGQLMVNGVPIDESEYLRTGMKPSARPFDVVVPEDSLWVLGDNRSNSQDSRAHRSLAGHGTIPVDAVVGRVLAIVWPWGRRELLDAPKVLENPGLNAPQE